MALGEQSASVGAASGDLVGALLDCRHDLVTFLARRVRCTATAEDIAQDVFLRLMRSPIVARQPRSLIFHTAANLLANHGRNEKRRAEIRDQQFMPLQICVEERTPERLAIGREALRLLSIEIARWPARTREVFILNRCDGLTQREIGARLGISSTAIERHMTKAILRLSAWSCALASA